MYYLFNKALQSKDRFDTLDLALAEISGFLNEGKYKLSDYTLIEGREIFLTIKTECIGKDGKDNGN